MSVKFLIIRFSSIGDIVLTSPVVRMLKQQVEGAEIHYLTKEKFAFIPENNPYIDKTISFDGDWKKMISALKSESYDHIIDLHNNLRTRSIKKRLALPYFTFDKLNIKKWIYVNFKKNLLPNKSIVDRYLESVSVFDIKNDHKGLDYFIPKKDKYALSEEIKAYPFFDVIVIGGTYFTKQIPENKIIELIDKSDSPFVLLGGKEDISKAKAIQKQCNKVLFNLVGEINLNQSASVIEQARAVVTSDTGLMHIAAAFNKPILSLWGNTVPEFGMYPYLPHSDSKIFEIKLSCRPCSKIGFDKCKKEHFNCMQKINIDDVNNHLKKIAIESNK